jgi:hypothetical protein
MSRPGGPYRDERYPPQQHQVYPPDPYQQQGYPQQGYPDQGYGPDYGQGYPPGRGQGQGSGPDYGDGYTPDYGPDYGSNRGYDRGYDEGGYGQRAPERPRPSAPPEPERDSGGGFRFPGVGLGLICALLAIVVQALSLSVLPWAAEGGDSTLPSLWKLMKDVSAGGFSGSYVLMFSYPLAVLGVMLSLVAVLQSVVTKVLWAVLALIGVGALALKFGWTSISGGGFEFSRQQITFGIIALGVLVVVIFMLRMAMSTFRIVGGLILLGVAGVHFAALNDLSGGEGFSTFGIGAYGPAVGYVLSAVATFVGPRKLT